MHAFKLEITPARTIAAGFALVIILGAVLLRLPFCLRPGVTLSFIDSLYTATSAVCVTGLVVTDTGSTFSPMGEALIALLIQIGGLGVAAVGTGVMVAFNQKLNFKSRYLIRDSFNLNTMGGIIRFLKSLLMATLVIELLGAVAAFTVFIKSYDFWTAVGVSCFHSIASFNNAGFDIFGTGSSMYIYRNNVWLTLVTIILIFLGGIGFVTINEIYREGLHYRKWSLNTCVSLSMSIILLFGGALLFRCTESFNWGGAIFYSMSARTAGFSTIPLNSFTVPGLMTLMALMFIGCAPGSTGGGIKTTTFFTLVIKLRHAVTNKPEEMFHYSIPEGAFKKAAMVFFMGGFTVYISTFLLMYTNPSLHFLDALVEMISAYATVGLSTGITSSLNTAGKLLTIIVMYIGRLGPLTVATLWYYEDDAKARYPADYISIG